MNSTEYAVQPHQDFAIPGTGLTVHHKSDTETYVEVLDNEAVQLQHGDGWTVSVTTTDTLVERSEVVALLRALAAQIGLDGYEPSELDAAIDETARRVAGGADLGLEAARIRAATKPLVQAWLRRNGGTP